MRPNQYGIVRRAVISVIGPSIAYVPLPKGVYALIDSDDSEMVDKYNWHLPKASAGRPYPKSRIGRKTVPLHRYAQGDCQLNDAVVAANAALLPPHQCEQSDLDFLSAIDTLLYAHHLLPDEAAQRKADQDRVRKELEDALQEKP